MLFGFVLILDGYSFLDLGQIYYEDSTTILLRQDKSMMEISPVQGLINFVQIRSGRNTKKQFRIRPGQESEFQAT